MRAGLVHGPESTYENSVCNFSDIGRAGGCRSRRRRRAPRWLPRRRREDHERPSGQEAAPRARAGGAPVEERAAVLT